MVAPLPVVPGRTLLREERRARRGGRRRGRSRGGASRLSRGDGLKAPECGSTDLGCSRPNVAAVVCAGDLLDWGPSPGRCSELLHDNRIPVRSWESRLYRFGRRCLRPRDASQREGPSLHRRAAVELEPDDRRRSRVGDPPRRDRRSTMMLRTRPAVQLGRRARRRAHARSDAPRVARGRDREPPARSCVSHPAPRRSRRQGRSAFSSCRPGGSRSIARATEPRFTSQRCVRVRWLAVSSPSRSVSPPPGSVRRPQRGVAGSGRDITGERQARVQAGART